MNTLTDPTLQRSGRYVHLPTYRLWLRKKEYEALTSSLSPVQQPAGISPVQQPVGFGQLPTGFSPSRGGGVLPRNAVQPQSKRGRALPSTKSEYPPPPQGNPQPGWQTIGQRFNDQWYWDGQQWTGHRRWIARQWVEDPKDS